MPRCLRGTVLPPRMRRPSSVFWDMRLLFFLALLRWLKSTVMATDRRAMRQSRRLGGGGRDLTPSGRGARDALRGTRGTRARLGCTGVERAESGVETVASVRWSPRGRGLVWQRRRRVSALGGADGSRARARQLEAESSRVTSCWLFLIANGDTSYASSSSSSRGYGTEACPLQAKPVYPLRRAWMLPTASSLTLKLHVRGCQDDQEENS